MKNHREDCGIYTEKEKKKRKKRKRKGKE